jgi:hypothetical protein
VLRSFGRETCDFYGLWMSKFDITNCGCRCYDWQQSSILITVDESLELSLQQVSQILFVV